MGNNDQFTSFGPLPQKRINQRMILPTAVQGRSLSGNILLNSSITDVTFSINNGVTLTITSRITSQTNENVRIGLAPFMITLYEAASVSAINPGTNGIPQDVATGRYTVTGPIAMPNFTVDDSRQTATGTYFASDGNDLVYKTSIANNSGGTRDITALVQVRVLQNQGGAT